MESPQLLISLNMVSIDCHFHVNFSVQICVSKLEVETIELAFTLECIYAFGFLVIGIVITYVTKKTLICEFKRL